MYTKNCQFNLILVCTSPVLHMKLKSDFQFLKRHMWYTSTSWKKSYSSRTQYRYMSQYKFCWDDYCPYLQGTWTTLKHSVMIWLHGQFQKRRWIHVKRSMVTTHKHAPESYVRPTEIVKQPNIEQAWVGLQLGYVTYRQEQRWKRYLASSNDESITATRVKQHSDIATSHGSFHPFNSTFQIKQQECCSCWGGFIRITAHHPS
jgi:hypothetical protein